MTIFYNKRKTLSKRLLLRRNQTPEESILWARLRRNQLGVKFKRQYSVGPYVIDFYCPEKKLAIELDGSQHLENKEYDEERSAYLAVLGIQTIRFWNNEVNANIHGVTQEIISKLGSPSPY
jgi:very-short-patch-repair endonuclease